MLDQFLDDTRAALLAGDFAGLEALLQAAPPASAAVAGPDAARLRVKAAHNARLIEAALRGLRSARGLPGHGARPALFSTYDAQGQRGLIGAMSADRARRF